MTTPTRKRSQQPSSCPKSHVPAGHVVPLRLSVKQQAYYRRRRSIRLQPLRRYPTLLPHQPTTVAIMARPQPRVQRLQARTIPLCGRGQLPHRRRRHPRLRHRRIKLPYLGSVKLDHTLPQGIIYEAHISFRNGQWLLSIGWWEAQRRIDQLHRRIVGMRKNAQHLMTSHFVHKFQKLVIEDLHVAGLMQGPTPKAQADATIGELKRQIIYKGQWQHREIRLAHPSAPPARPAPTAVR